MLSSALSNKCLIYALLCDKTSVAGHISTWSSKNKTLHCYVYNILLWRQVFFVFFIKKMNIPRLPKQWWKRTWRFIWNELWQTGITLIRTRPRSTRDILGFGKNIGLGRALSNISYRRPIYLMLSSALPSKCLMLSNSVKFIGNGSIIFSVYELTIRSELSKEES